MNKALRVAAATAAIGITTLSLTAPAHAGGSAVGAGIIGFGVGALLGSLRRWQALTILTVRSHGAPKPLQRRLDVQR
jgi:hypothetical protein